MNRRKSAARERAIKLGLPTYEGKPCKRGHGTTRDVKDKNCPKCKAMLQKEYKKYYRAPLPREKIQMPHMDFSQDNVETRW